MSDKEGTIILKFKNKKIATIYNLYLRKKQYKSLDNDNDNNAILSSIILVISPIHELYKSIYECYNCDDDNNNNQYGYYRNNIGNSKNFDGSNLKLTINKSFENNYIENIDCANTDYKFNFD